MDFRTHLSTRDDILDRYRDSGCYSQALPNICGDRIYDDVNVEASKWNEFCFKIFYICRTLN
jgi:hypothetical protein